MCVCGGPLEATGRLPYIDGCSDSLLIPPPVWGDPCFNHLHFPGGVTQTQHTHPSGRAGSVARGRGWCLLPGEGGALRKVPLEEGAVFVIPAGAWHSFETEEGVGMDVVAYHPDSDFGPRPLDHPMVNRTMVEGVSARAIPGIQTAVGPGGFRV